MILTSRFKAFIYILFSFHPLFVFAAANHSPSAVLQLHDSNPPVYAAVPASFLPFYSINEEGLPYGFAIEVMNEIDHHAGYLTKYLVKENWEKVFKSVASGETTIIPNLGITEERKKHYFFTKPYVSVNISIIVSQNNRHLSNIKALKNKKIAVVKSNVGKKIAENMIFDDIIIFDTINLALQAIVENKADALIYPKKIALLNATNLGVRHKIHIINEPVKIIHRAIAISKNHPELFEKFNKALDEYLLTQDYKDTYIAWMGDEPDSFSLTEYLLFDILLLLASIIFFRWIWKKKNFSILRADNKKTTEIIWVLTLIAILVTSMTVITGSTLWILYETAFEEQRHRLVDTVKSRARLIESIARHETKKSSETNSHETHPVLHTLDQVINAHNQFRGFGITGEFTLARHSGENIEFILRHRHSELNKPESIVFDSDLAIPMRLALLGHSGTIIGKDYRGEIVLAAYEPVSVLNLGIVAKMDLSEIRRPFIHSGMVIISILIIITVAGSLLFFYIIIPILHRMKETEHRFQQLFRNNQTTVLLVNPDNGKIVDANEAAIRFYGYNLDELSTYNISTFYPETTSETTSHLIRAKDHSNLTVISKHRLQDGSIRDVEIITSPVDIDDQVILYYVVTDITQRLQKEQEHERLQNDLEQARKMEALGQLTGGIAHDFNNMLGVIMGYTNLSLEKFKSSMDEKQTEYLEQVLQASDRAKDLISQMMVFSRTEKNKNQPMNVASLIKQDIKMLRSVIPSSIIINQEIDENLPKIMIEPVKLQQMLMNLSINAKDAMESHGTLGIKLQWAKDVHARCHSCFESITGDWIELTITDTGSGMPEDVLKHIFEPFFTTKVAGKGTGMGMAMVHGIVKDLEGHITIYSQPGQGTEVHLLFRPVYEDEIETKDEDKIPVTTITNKNILIVDDEESLATLLSEALSVLGYNCTAFSSSEEALKAFYAEPEQFDLVISDQTMPGLTGTDMIIQMRQINAELPAILATGYSETVDENIADQLHIHFFEKPVNMPKLLRVINEIFIDSQHSQ